MTLFKNKRKKEGNLSGKRVLSNNLYVLKIIQKVAPLYLVTYFLWSVGNAIIGFIQNSYLLRYVVNTLQTGGNVEKIFIFIAVFGASYFVYYIIIGLLRFFLYPRYNRRITATIQKMMFQKSKEVEIACYEDPKFYDKYVRSMDNTYQKSMDVVYTIDELIWSVVSLSANTFLIIAIDPVLVIFALLPLVLGFVENKRNKILHEFDCKRNPIDRKINYVQRTFYLGEYAKEMRLGKMYKCMFDKQKESWHDYKKLIKDYGFAKGSTIFITNFGRDGIIVLGAMLYATYQAIVTGNMLLGDCIVVLNSIGIMAAVLTQLVSNVTNLNKNAIYIEDFRYFMDYEPKIKSKEGKAPRGGDITLENVTFTYDGASTPSIENVNITIRSGEKIALVGHNGSGKSTFVKLLMRLYDPTQGRILQGGDNVDNVDIQSYRDQFATVFQDFKIFSLSVAENVLMRPFVDGDEETVVNALRASGAYERVQKMPHGIHTILTREFDDEGENLSGGEAQKIALARIFAKPSDIVIVDEPSSALDPIAEYKLFENLLSACDGKTMIFISHRLSSAVLADRVVYMDAGRITEVGSHAELMKKGGAYAELFKKQAENYSQSADKEGL